MAILHTYEVGYCMHPACVALKGSGFKLCRFPARAYVIEVGRELWVWDTGYASHFHTRTAKGIYRLYPAVTPVHFQNEEALILQLAQQGITGKDIRGMVLSHFHGDHIAGLRDFPGVEMYASKPGWEYHKTLKGLRAVRKGFVPGLIPDDFESRIQFVEQWESCALPPELAPFESGWALPDSDGEVFVVSLPGHARGHIGAFIHTETGWVLLAADAAWAPENYTELRQPAWIARLIMDDASQMLQTLQKLHVLHQRGVVKILLAHEGGIPSAVEST
ncbi:MBL fold metallo-hydrolase [Alcaligenaceae bacterium 429]|nr:MBL fold metallo-hydrolase [Alcaligenaceae bacterium 429]